MSRRLLATALLSASALFAHALPAQSASPLVGKWTIEYERGRRIENGEVSSVMGKGTMTVAQQGDSLIATLDLPPRDDGTPVPVMKIVGKNGPDGAVFVQIQKITLNMNGEATTHDAKVTWSMKATGDTLTGSIAREMPMMEPQEPGPLKGTRLKA
jgi:hypothetical protein